MIFTILFDFNCLLRTVEDAGPYEFKLKFETHR